MPCQPVKRLQALYRYGSERLFTVEGAAMTGGGLVDAVSCRPGAQISPTNVLGDRLVTGRFEDTMSGG